MPALKHMVKVGNSRALILDKVLLDALDITEETPLYVTVQNRQIIVTPGEVTAPETERRTRVKRSSKKVMDRYGPVFKKLAQ